MTASRGPSVPSHSMFDGDTIFAMATGDHEIDAGASTAGGP